jgi:glycosyltransferase involved in cell wall biosynthesis
VPTIEAPAPLLSVIIATKDRAEALRTISLPALAAQDSRDFDVIVWDASECDTSQQVVEAFMLANEDVNVRHYRAPRAGLPAQRNDAIKEALGDIIFFIDDDSEVSPDGVATLIDMFAKQQTLAGGCLPLEYWWPRKVGKSLRRAGSFGAFLLTAHARFFHPSTRLSGVAPASMPSTPGLTDFLPGCDMAFRKEIFRDHGFNERLQRFAGYALWEDQQFTRQLHLEGRILLVAEKGLVVHRAAVGERLQDPFNRGRIEGYNAAVIWRTTIFPFSRRSALHFLWARIGFLGVVLLPCLGRPWQSSRWKRLAGYLAGLGAFMLEEVQTLIS